MHVSYVCIIIIWYHGDTYKRYWIFYIHHVYRVDLSITSTPLSQHQHFSLIVFLCLRSNADFSGDILHRGCHRTIYPNNFFPTPQTLPNEKCLRFFVLWTYGAFHNWNIVPICNLAFKSHTAEIQWDNLNNMESICVTGIHLPPKVRNAWFLVKKKIGKL